MSYDGYVAWHTFNVSISHLDSFPGRPSPMVVPLIGLFCWHRTRCRSDDLNGNFDPYRVVHHAGHPDLAGAKFTPYSYELGIVGGAAGSGSTSGGGNMWQYHESQALLEAGSIATSGSPYAPTASDSASASPSSTAHSSQHGACQGRKHIARCRLKSVRCSVSTDVPLSS